MDWINVGDKENDVSPAAPVDIKVMYKMLTPPQVCGFHLDYLRRNLKVVKTKYGGCYAIVDGNDHITGKPNDGNDHITGKPNDGNDHITEKTKIIIKPFSFLVPQTFTTTRDLIPPPPTDAYASCMDFKLYEFVTLVAGAGDRAMERVFITDRNERTQRPPVPSGKSRRGDTKPYSSENGMFNTDDLEQDRASDARSNTDDRAGETASKRMRLAMAVAQERSNHADAEFTLRHSAHGDDDDDGCNSGSDDKFDLTVLARELPIGTRFGIKMRTINDPAIFTSNFINGYSVALNIVRSKCPKIAIKLTHNTETCGPQIGPVNCKWLITEGLKSLREQTCESTKDASNAEASPGEIPNWFSRITVYFMVRHALRVNDGVPPVRYWLYDYTLDDVGSVASDILGLSNVSDDDVHTDDLERIAAIAKVVSEIIALGMKRAGELYGQTEGVPQFITRDDETEVKLKFAQMVSLTMQMSEMGSVRMSTQLPVGEIQRIERAMHKCTREMQMLSGDEGPSQWLMWQNAGIW
jgi:hypothetical protein